MIKMEELKKEIPYVDYLPSHWSIVPNRYLFRYDGMKVGQNFSKYQLLSLTKEGVKEKDINAGGGKVPDSYDNYQTVKKGQMIFCLFDLDCSAVFSGLSSYDGMITSAYDVFTPTDLIDGRYADYWFKYVFTNRYYMLFSKNIRYTVSSEIFNSLKTPVPPKEEQQRIADFLDKKCSQIERLIKLQENEIEKLKEYKTSLITEKVSYGIENNVILRESGIEWLGSVPEHWEVKKLKFAYVNRNEKYTEGIYPYIALENIESHSGLYVETETNSNYELAGSILAEKGDVIFGKLRPYLAKALYIREKSYVSSEFAVFGSDVNSTEFLKYLFLSSKFIDVINSSTYGTKMPRANIDFIKNLEVGVPSRKEQDIIVEFLNRKCCKIDELVAIKKKKIKELEEYKKSLIYECVTGKKEI